MAHSPGAESQTSGVLAAAPRQGHLRPLPDLLPATDEACVWWDPNDAELLGQRVEGNHEFDCTVIGAGHTGLAVARRLAELRRDWRIAIIDALRVGQTASGRNSGYVVDTGHFRPERGVDGNQAYNRLSRHGIELLENAVTKHGIDCDWHNGGRIHACAGARGERELRQFQDGLDAMKEPYQQLSRIELEERVGTKHYWWGLEMPGGALVQPTKLVRGLARHLPDNVTLFEDSPVERIEPVRPRRLIARGGQLESQRLVLATNGFTSAWGLSRNRLLPIVTFASATAPLERAPGRVEQWGIISEDKMGSTVRLSKDKRILMQWGVSFRTVPRLRGPILDKMRLVHRRSLAKRFPELAYVPFTHSWGGVLGVTGNGGSRFGPIGDDAWTCAGHNGVGIAIATGLGDVLAHHVAGEEHDRSLDTAALRPPSWLPPQPLLGMGVSLYTSFLARRAGEEV